MSFCRSSSRGPRSCESSRSQRLESAASRRNEICATRLSANASGSVEELEKHEKDARLASSRFGFDEEEKRQLEST